MNIVFVCQQGELEIKAILLAWSLRNTLGSNPVLIAACPDYKDWGKLSPATTSIFNQLKVVVKSFVPPFGDVYPIGNKLAALGLLPENQIGCFLDSDMLSIDKWSLESPLKSYTSMAKPADVGTWGDDSSWEQVYRLNALAYPERRVRLTVSKQLSLPYFNAGMIATRKPLELSRNWLEIAKLLNSNELNLENKYPWLDQISLPLAFEKIGSWGVLNESYNFPAHLRPLAESEVALCHYHHPGVILREPRLCAIFEAAHTALPEINDLLLQSPIWSALAFKRFKQQRYSSKQRNFFITGIPRSGTSYLTSILDGQENWLVLNEPAEIFSHLQNRTDASGVALYHMECRERVLSGLPISNKVKDGKVIEDTAILDQQESYHPAISRSDFWLGSKNTLAYMAALEYLTALKWPIIAMIRHPLPTLASWRKTFNHLSEVRVSELPIANPNFLAWSSWQREDLREIERQDNAAIRRVLFWRLLARTILMYKEKMHVWRYEDLIENPTALISAFNTAVEYSCPIDIATTTIRTRSNDYDEVERNLLLDLCSPELAAFGYEI